MQLSEIIDTAIQPAMALLPDRMDSQMACVMLLAIGLQESRFNHRWQIVDPGRPDAMGPARGFWQFERGGGVAGVLRHPLSAEHARKLCQHYGVRADAGDVWQALSKPEMDGLAAGFARLLIWTDPRKLPAAGDAGAAWDLYIRTWRPGKPHRSTWDALYAQALTEVHR